ncbi:MAG: hypothetical protein WCE64_10280 [Bacteroidales bacterium]
MIRSAYTFLIAIAFLISGISCSEKNGRHFDQGEIDYDVQYTGHVTLLPRELMPRNLIFSFKDNKTLYELVSPFGNSGIINLNNPEKGIHDSYLSMFTIRYYYPSKPGEMFPGFEAMQGMEIRRTLKTTEIIGFKCKNAEVTFPSDRSKIYNIWYTNEIPVKDPNASTPFSEIDGVLLRFFFFIGESEFQFRAENIYHKEIPDKLFERRQKFQRVSKADINKFINKMVSL